MLSKFERYEPITLQEAVSELLENGPGSIDHKYLVMVIPEGSLPIMHRCFNCESHEEAREVVVAQHISRGFPTSERMTCKVWGMCRGGGCGCGKVHTKTCEVKLLEEI